MAIRTVFTRPLRAVAIGLLAVAVFAGGALAAGAFSDVGDDHPASAEITAAHQIGVFQGYGDGTFRPDGKLTQRQAENVIWRILSWQGTDDDGNFEISRADAAVLAMTGLCGLAPDRIPACAAVSAAAEKTAYARGYNTGYDDGLNAAESNDTRNPSATDSEPPTGSTPAQIAGAVVKVIQEPYRDVEYTSDGTFHGHYTAIVLELSNPTSEFIETTWMLHWVSAEGKNTWAQTGQSSCRNARSHLHARVELGPGESTTVRVCISPLHKPIGEGVLYAAWGGPPPVTFSDYTVIASYGDWPPYPEGAPQEEWARLGLCPLSGGDVVAHRNHQMNFSCIYQGPYDRILGSSLPHPHLEEACAIHINNKRGRIEGDYCLWDIPEISVNEALPPLSRPTSVRDKCLSREDYGWHTRTVNTGFDRQRSHCPG